MTDIPSTNMFQLSLSFNVSLWSAGLFFWLGLSHPFLLSKFQRNFLYFLLGQIQICTHTICPCLTWIARTIIGRSPSQHSRTCSCTLFKTFSYICLCGLLSLTYPSIILSFIASNFCEIASYSHIMGCSQELCSFLLIPSAQTCSCHIICNGFIIGTIGTYVFPPIFVFSILFLPFSYLPLFGLVLWHLNHCRLLNANSIFYTYKQFYFKLYSSA